MVAPSSLASSSILPNEQLISPLRVSRPSWGKRVVPSGYRGVYHTGTYTPEGHPIFVAKFKYGGAFSASRGGGVPIPGSYSTLPHVCATFVARRYEEVFGPTWREVVAARKVSPFQIRHSPTFGGYVASVWVLGRREEVTVLRRIRGDRWRVTDTLAVFTTREAARAGMQLYLVRMYGLVSPFVLWRSARAARSGKRAGSLRQCQDAVTPRRG